MKPLFTVHAGEYLVASFLERNFKKVNLWIPSRDTGIDLLATDRRNRRTVSLQVKYSKDFLVTSMGPAFQEHLRACGWWTINRDNLQSSAADFWVFVLQGFASRSTDCVVIPPRELLRRLSKIHGRSKTLQSYLWVTRKGQCWEARGLKKAEQLSLAYGEYRNPTRDLSRWLNEWAPLRRLNR